jgi:hypothetical protein
MRLEGPDRRMVLLHSQYGNVPIYRSNSRSLPLVSKSKPYGTLVLNLLLHGCENWVLTAPLRQRLSTFHNRCVRAMAPQARPQRTSFSNTNDHPAPFIKRPALAPMYTALGLTRQNAQHDFTC